MSNSKIKMSIILKYMKSFTCYLMLFVLMLYFLAGGGYVGQLVWLAHWSNHGGDDNLTL